MPHNISNPASSISKNYQEAQDLTEIAARISKNAASLKNYLNAQGLPQPSFAANAACEFPNPSNESMVQVSRESILEDTKTLSDLILGPVERLKWTIWPVIDQVYANLGQNHIALTLSS